MTNTLGATIYGVGCGNGSQVVTLPDTTAVGEGAAAVVTNPPGSVNYVGAPAGGIQQAMRTGLQVLCKTADGGQANFVLDAERSNPAIGLIYARRVSP